MPISFPKQCIFKTKHTGRLFLLAHRVLLSNSTHELTTVHTIAGFITCLEYNGAKGSWIQNSLQWALQTMTPSLLRVATNDDDAKLCPGRIF